MNNEAKTGGLKMQDHTLFRERRDCPPNGSGSICRRYHGRHSEAPPLEPIRTSLRHCRSLFPGNGILRDRDSSVEKAGHIQPIVNRDKGPERKPTNSALFARHRKISVCMGLRGGAERTRTSNQTIIGR
jgi:hypothetical protein